MPRNGAGLYSLPAPPSPFSDGTKTSAPDVMTVLNDAAAALTASIAYDGQTTTTKNIPFAKGLTVITGGVTVTAGGLSVASGGATITGNSTVTGTLTVTTAATAGNEVPNLSQFPTLLAGTGSINLPGGLQLRWGDGSVGGSGDTSVGYSSSFTTGTLQCVVGLSYTPGSPPSAVTVAAAGFTNSGFSLGTSAACGYRYIAIGY